MKHLFLLLLIVFFTLNSFGQELVDTTIAFQKIQTINKTDFDDVKQINDNESLPNVLQLTAYYKHNEIIKLESKFFFDIGQIHDVFYIEDSLIIAKEMIAIEYNAPIIWDSNYVISMMIDEFPNRYQEPYDTIKILLESKYSIWDMNKSLEDKMTFYFDRNNQEERTLNHAKEILSKYGFDSDNSPYFTDSLIIDVKIKCSFDKKGNFSNTKILDLSSEYHDLALYDKKKLKKYKKEIIQSIEASPPPSQNSQSEIIFKIKFKAPYLKKN